MTKKNRKIKDSLFCDLFGKDKDAKKNFLSLYNALHGTDLKLETTTIEQKTIPQSVYKTFNNDVSMLINGQLIILLEHQSTINENMPFRMLEYVTRIYETMIKTEDRYQEKRIIIPQPEFYVFYNGAKEYPEHKTLKLSDSFSEIENIKPQLELEVQIYNLNYETLNIVNRCDILKQYCSFIELIRKMTIPDDELTYKNAIETAIKSNILKDYLKRNSTEAINMLIAEYDYETDMRVKCREAKEEGFEEAKLLNAVIAVTKFNLTPEDVSKEFNVPLSILLKELNK